MWIGHWVIGEGFYIGLSVAIWIEGTGALQRHDHSAHYFLNHLTIQRLSALVVFVAASIAQYICHAHLYSLRAKAISSADPQKPRYSLPQHTLFRFTHTPHYFTECLIYLALSVLTAPVGYVVNKTILCAMIFVVVNLGVTAHGTAVWYEQKFGKQATRGRARMIPLMY
ncbi:hypothetical protein LTR95_013951 [Oleoguttula sp. CCFEE 5521]